MNIVSATYIVSAWQIARKEKEGDGERRYAYMHIPGAELKIHVNIIRLTVHFLAARTLRGSSYDQRARHENRRFDIVGC